MLTGSAAEETSSAQTPSTRDHTEGRSTSPLRTPACAREVVPEFVEVEVAVLRPEPAGWQTRVVSARHKEDRG